MQSVKSAKTPQAAGKVLSDTGITIQLPNGRKVDFNQFSNMMQGKTPDQAARELGIEPSALPFTR